MIHEVIQPFSKSEATLTTYAIDNSEEMEHDRLRPAIIICPGGGYEFLSDSGTLIRRKSLSRAFRLVGI